MKIIYTTLYLITISLSHTTFTMHTPPSRGAFHFCDEEINNTLHQRYLPQITNTYAYSTLKPGEKKIIDMKVAKRDVALKNAELELKQILANRNVLRANLEYNF